MGKKDESIETAKRAHQLDPLSLHLNSLLVSIFFVNRCFDEALEYARRAIEMDENYTFVYFHQGLAYVSKGLYQEAIAAFQKLLSLTGEVPLTIGLLGSAYGRAGQKDEALKMLERMNELSKTTFFRPFYYFCIYMGLGEMDQAFECLEKAYMEGDPWMVICGFSPHLDPLRSYPRFPELLKKIGFEN